MYITTHEFCTYSNAPTTQPVSHYQCHPLLWVADRQTCGELAVHEGTTVHDGVMIILPFDHMVTQKTLQTLWKRNKPNKTTIPQQTRNNTKCITLKHTCTYTHTQHIQIHTYLHTDNTQHSSIHTQNTHPQTQCTHTHTHSPIHTHTHTHRVSSLHIVDDTEDDTK